MQFAVRMLVSGWKATSIIFTAISRFSNNTNTLSDGVRRSPYAVPHHELSGDYSVPALGSRRIEISLTSRRRRLYAGQLFGKLYRRLRPAGSGSAAASKSLVGWVAGAGWEYALPDHWTFRAEYLFASFPTVNALGAINGRGRWRQYTARLQRSNYPAPSGRRELTSSDRLGVSCSNPRSLPFIAGPQSRACPVSLKHLNRTVTSCRPFIQIIYFARRSAI